MDARQRNIERSKRWAKENRLKHNALTRKYQQQRKRKCIEYYSKGAMSCVKCGYQDLRALSIDHVNGDGCKHKKGSKIQGVEFYRWLIKNNFPPGYQVLCMNCQFVKRDENKEYYYSDRTRNLSTNQQTFSKNQLE